VNSTAARPGARKLKPETHLYVRRTGPPEVYPDRHLRSGPTAPIIIHLDQPLMIRLPHAFVLEPATKRRAMLIKLRDGPPRLASSVPERHLLILHRTRSARSKGPRQGQHPPIYQNPTVERMYCCRSLARIMRGENHLHRKRCSRSRPLQW
jgi:hypothetical protein